MRSTTTRKFLAVAYGLGLVWAVAMLSGAAVLMQPMLQLYEALGIESAVIHTTLTMSLVVLLATSVTATVGLVAHAAVGHSDARRATPMTPEAARQRV